MAAHATMTAMATVKTAWRTLSRVELVGNRKWLTCLKLSIVMAAHATMTAMATVKTAWRTLSRVEHEGNRKWLTCLKQSMVHCPKTLETKIMLLELMMYRMYTCVLLDIKNLYSLYKNLLRYI